MSTSGFSGFRRFSTKSGPSMFSEQPSVYLAHAEETL